MLPQTTRRSIKLLFLSTPPFYGTSYSSVCIHFVQILCACFLYSVCMYAIVIVTVVIVVLCTTMTEVGIKFTLG